ncbi:MAG: hypothetical protein HOV96_26630 [Nonomuraea sp.]|nr:hypothetical protein [Nonomuraea sp.]
MILSVRRPFPLFVAGLAILQAGLSLDGITSAQGYADLGRGLSGLSRSIGALAPLVLLVPIGILLDRTRPRAALLTMGLLAAAATVFTWFASSLWFASFPYAVLVGVTSATLVVAAPIAQETYVPAVAGRDRLLRSNAFMFAASALAAAGADLLFSQSRFFGWLSLPFPAVLLLVAVALFWLMRTPSEQAPSEQAPSEQALPAPGFLEVVRFARAQPVIRAIGAYLVLTAIFEPMASEGGADVPGLRAGALTFDLLDLAAAVAGAGLAVLLGRGMGMLRLAWVAVVATQPFALLLLLADDTPWGVACHWLALYVPLTGWTVTAIALLGLRQEVVPDGMLGRVAVLLILIAIPPMVVGQALVYLPALVAVPLGVAGLLVAARPLWKAERVAEPETETPVAG